MKLQIKCLQNPLWISDCWQVKFNGTVNNFNNFPAAVEYGRKLFKRYYKEMSAFAMTQTLAINLLSVIDLEFIKKLKKSSCKGITPKQYGYLKGIYERQKAEW